MVEKFTNLTGNKSLQINFVNYKLVKQIFKKTTKTLYATHVSSN